MMWQRDTSGECPDEDEGSATITDGSTSYDIMGLEEDFSYSITVAASNAAGSNAVSKTLTAMTLETGGEIGIVITCSIMYFHAYSSICCPHFCESICSDFLQHHCPVGGSGLHPSQWRHNRLLSEVWGGGEWEYTDYECLRR